MSNLDLPTLRLAALVIVIGTLVMLATFWRNNKFAPGIGFWSAGILSYNLGFLLEMLAQSFPLTIFNVLIELSFISSSLLFLHGINIKQQLQSNPSQYLAILAFSGLFSLYFNYLMVLPDWRIIYMSLVIGLVSLRSSYLLIYKSAFHWSSPSFAGALSLLVYALYNLIKVSYLVLNPNPDYALLIVAFLGSCLFIAAITFTFILMAYDHLETSLDQALLQLQQDSELKLKGVELRWLQAQEVSNAGAWEVNISNGMLTVSAQWTSLLGMNTGEMSITTAQMMEFMHPDEVAGFMADMKLVELQQTDHFAHEHRLKTAAGNWIWVSSRGHIISNEHQEHVAIVGIDIDITESKLRQAALEQAIAEAEQAREIAVASNKAKSTFLTNVSHEIRTPMNAILGFSQLLMDDETLAEAQKENLEIINSSGQHLLSLIDDILNLSRIESGHFKIRYEAVNPGALFREISDYYQKRTIRDGVNFISKISDGLPDSLSLDPKAIRQICMNLLSNAFKFTDKGTVRFSVSLYHDKNPEHGRLIIEVIDSGVGIGSADLDRIFNAFEQTNEHSVSGEGFGLGLTICKNIVTQLGGRMEVQSEKQKGSQFTTILPVDILASEPAPKQEPALIQPDISYRVLIVDDIDSNRKLLQRLLSETNLSVREADNAKTALNIIDDWGPAVVLMDIRMPIMSGDEAIIALRKNPAYKNLPVIAITANAMEGERERLLSIGANDFISKPFLKDEIFAKLAQALNIPQLPSRQHAAPNSQAKRGKEPAVTTREAQSNDNIKILVVDDNIANQQLLTSQLRVLGFQADVATNGKLGYNSWADFRHQVVFADIAMPVMNGFEMASLIRAKEREEQCVQPSLILAITGSPEEYKERCYETGMDEVLGKPILMNTLSKALALHLPGFKPPR